MKALICFAARDTHITSFTERWTPCLCGNAVARWLDPLAGTVAVAARDRSSVRILGLSNALLIPVLTGGAPTWDHYRALHERATLAPNHVFDASRAGCWAVVIDVGRTSDIRWATYEEYLQVFP